MKTKAFRVATDAEVLRFGAAGCRARGLLPPIRGAAGPLPQTGAYPLTGTGQLPNADVAFPGEVWSNRRANGVIVPGSCVRPVVVGGVACVQPVVGGDTLVDDGDGLREQDLSVALRQIMTPDINPGSQYNPALGPNEIVNLPIADQDYVREYKSGVLNLTLVVPRADYAPGNIIGWNPTGTRPAGKASGTGAWDHVATSVAGSGIFVVHDVPRYYGSNNESVLTVRFLRANN